MTSVGTERFVMQLVNGEYKLQFYGTKAGAKQYEFASRPSVVEIWDFPKYRLWKLKRRTV